MAGKNVGPMFLGDPRHMDRSGGSRMYALLFKKNMLCVSELR
jgi:hypothetical protein